MPLVKPNFESMPSKPKLIPGRYSVVVREVTESDKLDRNGHNALVVKLSVFNHPTLNDSRISKWLPLGGPGAKVLFHFLRCIDPNYDGKPFNSADLLNKRLEVDIREDVNPKTNETWLKVDKVFPYLQQGSVGSNFHSNVPEKDVPSFDDFDK